MSGGEPVSEHTDVGAYALGLLQPADRQAFEQHLAGCAACTAELAELSGLKDLLTGLGPVPSAAQEPAGAEVVDLVRRHAADRRRRARWRVVVSAAAAVVLLAGGTSIGLTAASTPSRPAHSTAVTFTATSPATRVRGRVSLVAKPWGTVITLGLFRLAGPLDCQIVAVSRTGERQVLGSWLVPAHAHFGLPGHPSPLIIQGPSGIKIGNLSRIEVDVVNGHTLVSIPTPVTS